MLFRQHSASTGISFDCGAYCGRVPTDRLYLIICETIRKNAGPNFAKDKNKMKRGAGR